MVVGVIALGLIVALLVVWYVGTMNALVAKRNRMKQCESGISVVLKQRNDLIPNLVASVKEYMGHEKAVLTQLAELRSKSEGTESVQEQIRYGNQMTKLLGNIRATVEAYPELQSNEQMRQLMYSLENVEDELQAVRRTYNAAVTSLNNAIEMFPSSVVANMKGYTPAELIEIPEEEKKNVNVKELFS